MRILSSPKKWEDAPGVDFVGWCQREFSLPMKMENDARMALMGEAVCGSWTRLQRFGDDHPGHGHRHCRDGLAARFSTENISRRVIRAATSDTVQRQELHHVRQFDHRGNGQRDSHRLHNGGYEICKEWRTRVYHGS